jgi:hypothetical protein
VTYVEKLRFAERVIKAAQHRHDAKQAVRELCEAMSELVAGLLERELGHTAEPDKKPSA